MPEARSALAAGYRPGKHPNGAGELRITLGEVRGRDLVQVACWRGGDVELQRRLEQVFGFTSPEPGRFATDGEREVIATAPQRHWCTAPLGDPRLHALSEAISDDIGCVTALGHSHVRLRITGPAARRLLLQEIAIDLTPTAFPTASAARTVLHHVPVTLLAIDANDDRFDLLVPYTWAASTWAYLLDIATPFGYEVT